VNVRRRVLGLLVVASLGAGLFSAQAGTREASSAARAALAHDLAGICAHAARGTYGLPGHYCDSPASLYQEITGESSDRIAAEAQRAAIESAPYGSTPAHALATAIAQRDRLARRGAAVQDSHPWTRNGIGPLQAADAGYTGVNGLGLVELAGRVTDFAYDSRHRTVYASVATGGLFRSSDAGAHWVSVGENLPTQLVGSVGYTPADGGTLVVVTGDGSFGRSSLEGAGVFRSTDGGRSWQRAAGAPSDAFGFRVAVDASNPRVVYAATGAGLFRSDDAARSFHNVALPTGACAGKSNRTKSCLLANVVTDVVVQAPGGSTGAKGGQVLAAVGWRDGQAKSPDGSVQSPSNGIYRSTTGRAGTFARLAATGFTQQDHIGRIGLGPTTGPAQNHDYVYALVQNAKQTQSGGNPSVPLDQAAAVNSQINGTSKAVGTLDGVFVSPDFGATWVKMADGLQLASPTTGSALAVTGPALAGYGAGVQAWYNQFIKPDPTQQVGGVPTRMLFGLEEVWENENTGAPLTGPASFHVVGRYFSGSTCLYLDLLPACPTNRDEALSNTTTTHPDQHAVLFLPDGEGGVRVLVGNDGGVYTQAVGRTQDFANDAWGKGSNNGMTTLSPYNVARAKDGTIWMGLQDNGTAKITDVRKGGKVVARERQIEALGGDGFFVGVNPDNPSSAYGEYVGGAMSGTVDGGLSWNGMSPPITHGQFSTPFSVDPLDPNHVMVAGREVVETGSGPSTGSGDWATSYDLGTAQHPGSASAPETAQDAANSQTALDLYGANAYVGYCGVCDVLSDTRPFRSGLATNVGGKGRPARYSSSGWHIPAAHGLPERYITSVAMDHANPRVVYVTLGSYSRRYTPPGSISGRNDTGGHLYKSVDAGEHFTDVSADLPDAPANWVSLRGSQLLVATDIGVFASRPSARCGDAATRGCAGFEVLGEGLPAAPVVSMQVAPWDANLLTVASFGRGAYTYRFGPAPAGAAARPPALPAPRFLGKRLGLFDFESGAEGWTAGSSGDVEAWRLAPPGHSSSQSFQVLPYSNDTSVSLVSPRMALPARSTVEVSWWKTQDTEPCCDGLSVDWSSDGYVWHTVSTKTDQNKDYPDFSKDSVRFVAPAGRLLLRFRVTSDSLVSSPPYTGVRLDDIEVRR
jgi:hypothetical protein